MLPGVDDGATDLAMALAMAGRAAADGIGTVACTPHMMAGVYDNNGPAIRAAVEEFQSQLKIAGVDIKVIAGADVHVALDLDKGLRSAEVPTLNGSRYFLLEPPHHIAPPRFDELVFSLLASGFVPLITHPERLRWIEPRYDMLFRLVQAGALIQITAGSVTGRFGKRVQALTNRMIDDGLVHVLASDGHNIEVRPPVIAQAREMIANRVGREEAEHMVLTRPLAIVRDQPPSTLPKPTGAVRGSAPARTGWRRLFWPFSDSSGANRGGDAFAAAAALAIVLSGCVGPGSNFAATDASKSAPGARLQNASLPPPDIGAASGASTENRIGPADTIDVSVFQAPELNRSVQVDAAGLISLPLIGNYKAGGKTVREAETEIAGRYGARYLQSPQVSVALKDSPTRRVTIEGAVNKPGVYPQVGRGSLMQTVAVGGGLQYVGSTSGVVIFRMVEGKRISASYDLASIRDGKEVDPEVYPGDIVVVGESAIKSTLRDIGTVAPIAGMARPF